MQIELVKLDTWEGKAIIYTIDTVVGAVCGDECVRRCFGGGLAQVRGSGVGAWLAVACQASK